MTTYPFAGLQSELQATLTAMRAVLDPLPERRDPGGTTQYIVPLTTANSSQGHQLIGNGRIGDYTVVDASIVQSKAILDWYWAQGFRATQVTIGWPFLDRMAARPGDVAKWSRLYTQLSAYAKATGFHLTISCGTGGGVESFAHFTVDQVFQGIRRQALWIEEILAPDLLVTQAEVTSDITALAACRDTGSLAAAQAIITPSYWHDHLQAIMDQKPGGSTVLHAGGASPHDPHAYWDAAVATTLDVIDTHPFPLVNSFFGVGQQYWNTLFSRFDSAIAAGKRICETQTSLYPASAVEIGTSSVSYGDVYVREIWHHFQPEMTAFLNVWQQIALKYGLYAICNFFPLHCYVNTQPAYDATVTSYQPFEQANITSIVNGTAVLNANGQQWAGFSGGRDRHALPTRRAAPGRVL